MTTYYAGTSGLQTPIPKRDFPPDHQHRSRLSYYATLFNSIEINSSFYKLPKSATVTKWANEVPPYFKFTYKLWQEATHNKDLAYNPEHVKQFMQAIEIPATQKGCLLVQLPPSNTAANTSQLGNLLATIQNNNTGWKLAIEFRHPSWYNDHTYEVLANYSASIVLHDMPASAASLQLVDDDIVYLRFHGPEGRYRGSYEDELLNEYALYIKEWQEDGKTVYVYFNNTVGDALNNLITLNRYVKG